MSSHEWVDCPACYINYAIPKAMHEKAFREKDRQSVYCPNGHGWHFTGEREVDIERRKRQLLEQQNAQLAEEARDALRVKNIATEMLKRSQRELKQHKTRAAAGLCPCCNRSFVNMQRHMKTKHPDFNVVPLKDAS